ncbi:MAG: ATP synthase F1 subunit epsilon [Dehalococcoidia bacterium]
MPLHLTVVTAERTILDREDVARLIVPTVEGQITILPSHAPLMTALAIGEMVAVTPSGDEPMVVHGGFLQVAADRITVLADAAEHVDQIDEARAEEARNRAQRRLAGEHIQPEEGQVDLLRARLAMQRALVRLNVRRRRRGTGAPAMGDRRGG